MGHSSINVSLTYLRGLEIAELKEEDMPMYLIGIRQNQQRLRKLPLKVYLRLIQKIVRMKTF